MITTERLVLRPMLPEDADWIAREIANPNVQRWLTSPPHPYRLEDAQEFVAKFSARAGFRTIEHAGDPLGVISIEEAARFSPDRPSLPELGYWLRETAWGRGYATEAASALLDWHDRSTGGDVHSGYISGNRASASVLRKLGFSPLETIRRRAHFEGGDVTIHRVVRQPGADAHCLSSAPNPL
ncbi:GNAT family N-acetyltransferase [Antarctobacter jejuensis]|uniref:GNAT family N-acetyltransferase n=1 Tax=Antarctobacter jejuensis TaxID=1439938 RepID=UPI003FD4D5DE